jgi:hypothetical protein
MKTARIKYNVTERGRKHTGQARRFDTMTLCDIVNSPRTQERVKHGDMFGYFGHWPRIHFGMNPSEGGVVNGKQVAIEPAFRTVFLNADQAGNVEHEAEFLDTPHGRVASRLYTQNSGGFSSAIDTRKRNGVDIPTDFYGFDYVLEPNYTTNRGHKVALDSANSEELQVLFDTAAFDSAMSFKVLDGLYEALQEDHTRSLQTMSALELENVELRSMLLKKGIRGVDRLLDSANQFVRPLIVSQSHTDRLRHDIAAFDSIQKLGYVEDDQQAKDERAASQLLANTRNVVMGIRR